MEDTKRTRRSFRSEGISAKLAANGQGRPKHKNGDAKKEETARMAPLYSSEDVHTHLGATSAELLFNESSFQPSIKQPNDSNACQSDDIRSLAESNKREHFTRSKQESRQEERAKADDRDEQVRCSG
jgi:hypothetical protein